MRDTIAAQLTRKLGANWPGRATPEYLALVARKIQPWDADLADAAIERAIDAMTWLPSFAELRSLYIAAGGDLPDPGRRMSPPQEAAGLPLTAAERAAVSAARAEALARIRALRADVEEITRGRSA